MELKRKVEDSIAFIRRYAPLAAKFGGYTVAFSGGKDSQVMLDLFKKSGVNYHAFYNVTTNDPPENVYFIRKNYPEVEFLHPEKTFFQLIEQKKMLPTMKKRFCCNKLKEYSGKGLVAVGVRREESEKRAAYDNISFSSKKNRKFDEKRMRNNRKVLVRPILEWTEVDIWQYIEENNIPVNPCYEHSGRVGCLFCPYASTRTLVYYSKIYPRYYHLLIRSIGRILEKGYLKEFQPLTPQQVFEWWISKRNAKMYFSQLKLDL